jgi:uncharacterized lipoprotein YmbA
MQLTENRVHWYLETKMKSKAYAGVSIAARLGALIALLSLGSASCTIFPETAPAKLYSLDFPPRSALLNCSVKFALREVKIPGYLDRAEVPLGKVGNRIDMSASHLWAAPISKEITRVIGVALNEQLGSSELVPYPIRQNERPDWLLGLELNRVTLEENALNLQVSFSAARLTSQLGLANASFRRSFNAQIVFEAYDSSSAGLASRFASAMGKALDQVVKDFVIEGSKVLCPA